MPYARLLLVLLLTAGAGARAAEPADVKSIAERARSHWAFRPVCRPAVPTVKDPSWVRNPTDSFLLARLEKEGLGPNPPADRRTLLRRVYLDLVGLPPTPEEADDFLADPSPDAYARVVDALLASPHHGERYARHWLDVVRYGDTNGYERDGDKPFAWRYRDYVIASFNRDLPFDAFVREQVAGDELPGSDARTQLATTFLRLGTWDDEPANTAVDRYDQLDDVLGVTATAFLAQTIRCARCHDHKFEPFSQKEYYQLLSVFEPLRRPQNGRADLDRFVGTEAELTTYNLAARRHQEEMDRLRVLLDAQLAPARTRVLEGEGKLPAPVRAAFRTEPARRTAEQKQLVRTHQKAFDESIEAAVSAEERPGVEEARAKVADHQRRAPAEPPRAYIWYEDGPKAPLSHVLKRGNPNSPGALVRPGLPAVLAPTAVEAPRPLAHSTGRRLWLANWIASKDNPLTARVIVNRLWQWHFGRGLVPTTNDFGLAGDEPSHPELLDWLASELMEKGWSLEHVHRLIVLSSAYRTSATLSERGAAKHNLFGRWRQRRVEAEVLRDSALAVSGQLNRQMGGPGVYPPVPKEVQAGQSRPGLGWKTSDALQSARRSVYVFAKRSLAPPELELLDTPDNTSPCEQRPVSTTAPQALTLLNGAFFNDQALHFADRLRREAGPDRASQVRRAFTLALARPPRPDEVAKVLAFLTDQEQHLRQEAQAAGKPADDAPRRALAALCLVLLNSNEFAYPG